MYGFLKNNKAAGPDEITHEIIKGGGEIMTKSLMTILNLCLHLEVVPADWGKGIIIPLHKKGDKKDLNNYRGISLSSVIGKIYSRLIEHELSTHVENNEILGEIQGGFRKDRRTIDQIFILKNLAAIRKNRNQHTPILCI